MRDALIAAARERPAAGVHDEGRRQSAADARVVTFAGGEEMVAFGSQDHVFGLLVDGHASLMVRGSAGSDVRIATLVAGDFYGEATIAAGGKSEFRVLAETDVTAVEFDSASMAEWLQRSSGLAAEVGAAIDTRRRAARDVRHSSAEQQRPVTVPPAAAREERPIA